MTKKITFKKVKEYNQVKLNQRFYEASIPLVRGFGLSTSLREAMIKARDRLREEYRHLIPDNIESVTIICVSDAHTHIERLVFAGLPIGIEYGKLDVQIDGKYAFMSEGGNYRSVHPDEVYLRHSARLNGYKYKGVVK